MQCKCPEKGKPEEIHAVLEINEREAIRDGIQHAIEFPRDHFTIISVLNSRLIARSFAGLQIGSDWATLLAEKSCEWLSKYGTSVRDKDSAIVK
jgi:hypothetical protein